MNREQEELRADAEGELLMDAEWVALQLDAMGVPDYLSDIIADGLVTNDWLRVGYQIGRQLEPTLKEAAADEIEMRIDLANDPA